MTAIKALRKKGLSILKYMLGVALVSAAVIAVFALIYNHIGIKNPFKFSLGIYMQIEDIGIKSNVYYIGIAELIIKYIVFILYVGGYLSQYLHTKKQVFFSKYFIYDDNKQKFLFRYWIVMPSDEYLYDVHIRMFVVDSAKLTEGTNEIMQDKKYIFDSEYLETARGVRIVTLSKYCTYKITPKSHDERRYINDFEELFNKLNNKDNFIYIIMTATTEEGKKICTTKKYYKKDLLKNTEELKFHFVPIRESYYNKKIKNEKEFFRYNHFDKIQISDESVYEYLSDELKFDIIFNDEIKSKRYSTKNDIKNKMLSFIYNAKKSR